MLCVSCVWRYWFDVGIVLNGTDLCIVNWQKWTRYRMVLRGNVLMMFTSETKTTDTVHNHIACCESTQSHAFSREPSFNLLHIHTEIFRSMTRI